MFKKYSSYLKEKTYTPRLTVKGLIIYCANGVVNSQVKKFDWNDALVDAAITSAVTFFSALGGGAVAGLGNFSVIESALIAALAQFFVFLALKRGLIQSKEA